MIWVYSLGQAYSQKHDSMAAMTPARTRDALRWLLLCLAGRALSPPMTKESTRMGSMAGRSGRIRMRIGFSGPLHHRRGLNGVLGAVHHAPALSRSPYVLGQPLDLRMYAYTRGSHSDERPKRPTSPAFSRHVST